MDGKDGEAGVGFKWPPSSPSCNHGWQQCECRPPLLCWHGTPDQLPLKLSVGSWKYMAMSPVKKPQITLLVLLSSLCALRHAVGLKGWEFEEKAEETWLREMYVANTVKCQTLLPNLFTRAKINPISCLPLSMWNSTTWGHHLRILSRTKSDLCVLLIICVNLSRLPLLGFIGYTSYFKWRRAQQENK